MVSDSWQQLQQHIPKGSDRGRCPLARPCQVLHHGHPECAMSHSGTHSTKTGVPRTWNLYTQPSQVQPGTQHLNTHWALGTQCQYTQPGTQHLYTAWSGTARNITPVHTLARYSQGHYSCPMAREGQIVPRDTALSSVSPSMPDSASPCQHSTAGRGQWRPPHVQVLNCAGCSQEAPKEQDQLLQPHIEPWSPSCWTWGGQALPPPSWGTRGHAAAQTPTRARRDLVQLHSPWGQGLFTAAADLTVWPWHAEAARAAPQAGL